MGSPADPDQSAAPDELGDMGLDLTDSVLVRSRIQTTHVEQINIEGEQRHICPTCANLITDANHRLVCEQCKTHDFCEACERMMTKTPQYRGYQLNFDWPLCRDCYRSTLRRQVMEIECGLVEHYKPYDEPKTARKRRITSNPDALVTPGFEPILQFSHDAKISHVCAIISIVLGGFGIFIMGFTLGPPSIVLGYAAKVRNHPYGLLGMILGFFALASSVFWMLYSGGSVWYL